MYTVQLNDIFTPAKILLIVVILKQIKKPTPLYIF